RRFEPLNARHVAVARQKADARVAALVPEPRERGVGMFRLKRHREVGDDDEGLREGHIVDERNVRQVDPGFGRGAAIRVDRDIANRLEPFVCQRMLLMSDQIELRMPGETGFERAAEIGSSDTLRFIVQLDWKMACLDDSAELPAYVHKVGINIAVSRALAWSGDRPTAAGLGGARSRTK